MVRKEISLTNVHFNMLMIQSQLHSRIRNRTSLSVDLRKDQFLGVLKLEAAVRGGPFLQTRTINQEIVGLSRYLS